MKTSNAVKNAVHTLVCATVDTKDSDTLQQYVAENKDDIVAALATVGITDCEPLIEAAHMALYQVCPAELEEHVQGCAHTYIALIANAWHQFDEDCDAAVDDWFEQTGFKPNKKKAKGKMAGTLPAEPNPKDVEHLKKCFNI